MDQEENMKMNGTKNDSMSEESFLKNLYFFMKQRDTPIERIPHLGFKQINLYVMFKTVMELGGYHQVTAQQLWKKVYNILGGNPRSTSAATCTRRHYEKLLLPYEYHLSGYGDDIPITQSRQRKRFHYDEDDYSPNIKCQSFSHLHQYTQFIPPVPITSTSYSALPLPSIPTLHSLHPSHPMRPYFPSLPVNTGSVKQPLEFLRHLAQEYKSSSGWTEPLNLSKKPNRLEIPGNIPSSFTPPATVKKNPKFLNEVTAFYPGKMFTPGFESETPRSSDKLNETPISPLSSSSPKLLSLSSSSSLNVSQKINYLTSSQTNPQEPSIHVPGSKSTLSSTKSTKSSVSLDPYGGMEIQIPLSLLQTWIKDGLIQSSTYNQQQVPQPKSNDPLSKPEVKPSKTSDNYLFEYPADLSLKNLHRTGIKADTKSRENQASKSSYINPRQIPFYSSVPFFKASSLQELPIKPSHFATTGIQEQPTLKELI